VTEFLSVLDAQRSLLQAEQQYATSTTNVSLNLVQLFKALGGGWELTFPDLPANTRSRSAVVAKSAHPRGFALRFSESSEDHQEGPESGSKL
jgi:hypothetical protein